MRLTKPRVATFPTQTPRSGNFGATTHGPAGRTPCVDKSPTETSHFPRVIGAQKRAPHRRKTPPRKTVHQKWSKTCLKKNCTVFFDAKLFANFWRPLLVHQRRQRPDATRRETRRKEAFRDFRPRAEIGQPHETAELKELIRSPNSPKTDFSDFRMSKNEKGAKINLFGKLFGLRKNIFVAFLPLKFFSAAAPCCEPSRCGL